eukprot:184381-Pyramimonas_sp.AAC.1
MPVHLPGRHVGCWKGGGGIAERSRVEASTRPPGAASSCKSSSCMKGLTFARKGIPLVLAVSTWTFGSDTA